MDKKSNKLVEQLFKKEYGRLVSTLTRIFGTTHIQLAEDVVRETLISASNNWGLEGIPDNPKSWLIQSAKRKALNELRRDQRILSHHKKINHSSVEEYISSVFNEDEVIDNQLVMMFACCHPDLSIEYQLALMLKMLCGFGVKEVSRALLTVEPTINKRLYRAKKMIRMSEVSFSIPQGKELNKRLDTLCIALYLLFNEGYNAVGTNSLIRRDMCLEAIRLTKLLSDRMRDNKEVSALLALMCFHTARFDARTDSKGTIILFEDQDRSSWNEELIHKGMYYFKQSIGGKKLSAYHLEAGIAAEHCLAKSFDSTNWKSIHEQYKKLYKIKSSPVILLNMAIIASKIEGVDHSLSLLQNLEKNEGLKNYHLLPATQGVFHMKKGQFTHAVNYLDKAVQLTFSSKEKEQLNCYKKQCLSNREVVES